LYVFIGFSDLDQPDLDSCYMSSSAMQKSFLPFRYLSMRQFDQHKNVSVHRMFCLQFCSFDVHTQR